MTSSRGTACLALHNSDALACLAAVESSTRKKLKKGLHMLNSNIFVTGEVKKYCEEIDELFLNGWCIFYLCLKSIGVIQNHYSWIGPQYTHTQNKFTSKRKGLQQVQNHV